MFLSKLLHWTIFQIYGNLKASEGLYGHFHRIYILVIKFRIGTPCWE